MEDSLQKALLAAVQQMPAAVIIAEPNGRLVLANEQVSRIWRRPPLDPARLDDFESWERFHPDGRPLDGDEWPLQRALRGEVVEGEDIHIARGDGSMGVARVSAAPVYGDDGAIVAAVVTFYDVTPERQEQDALALLADASEVFGQALELGETIHRIAEMSVPKFADLAFVHLLDHDGIVVRQEVAAVDKRRLEELRRTWGGSQPGSTPVTQVIESGQPLFVPEVSEENWSYIDDPQQRADLMSLGIRSAIITPIRAKDETYGAMTFARTAASRPYERFDILVAEELSRRAAQAIERARLFDSERRARKQAEDASRGKDEFLAVISHELRTPLTTVIGWGDLLKMTYEGHDPAISHAIDALRASAAIQARLIDDLLDVSRLVAGKLNIEKRRIDLTAVVKNAAEPVRVNAETKGLTLTIDAGDPIPVLADPARVQQIVINLVANAIKFTPVGGHIDVKVQRTDGQASIVVSDSGVGISPDFPPPRLRAFPTGQLGRFANLHGTRAGAVDRPAPGATARRPGGR